jgi:hypothetical protein
MSMEPQSGAVHSYRLVSFRLGMEETFRWSLD